MASIAFPSLAKKATLSDGTTYGWASAPPSAPSKLTFLLIHGYPSSCYDWRHQIAGLRAAGYGVIAPDLLGYGDTDKPTDPAEYRMKRMCAHMIEILDLENVYRAVAVGHDWGVALVSRLATYERHRFYGIVTVSVSYTEPGIETDIDALCEQTKSLLGYETFGYWKWHNTEQAAFDCDANPASVFTLVYPRDPSMCKDDLGPTGKAAEFVRSGKTYPLPAWYSLSEYTMRDRIFSTGGYAAPLCWYKAAMHHVNAEDEATISEKDKLCPLPSMFVAAGQDHVCRADVESMSAKRQSPNGRIEVINCGHWVQLEEPELLNALLLDFVKEFTETREKQLMKEITKL